MKFFDPIGNEIKNPKEFVDFYSKCYFLNNSKVAEDEIMALFNNDVQPLDVMRVLEWKLGRIDPKRSQCEGTTIYRHLDEMERFVTKTRSGIIDAEKLSRFIASNYIDLKKEEPTTVFSKLVQNTTENLGTVYLITLVFFITQKCPIYDRFAHQAITAILGEKKPGAKVKYSPLPGKSDPGVYQSYQKNYVEKLEIVFPNYMDRDVDRALWVYGHLFQ